MGAIQQEKPKDLPAEINVNKKLFTWTCCWLLSKHHEQFCTFNWKLTMALALSTLGLEEERKMQCQKYVEKLINEWGHGLNQWQRLKELEINETSYFKMLCLFLLSFKCWKNLSIHHHNPMPVNNHYTQPCFYNSHCHSMSQPSLPVTLALLHLLTFSQLYLPYDPRL